MKKIIIMIIMVLVLTVHQALGACDSFEPLGSCPETDLPLRAGVEYNVAVTETSNRYYWNYTESDGTIISFRHSKTNLVNGTVLNAPFSYRDSGYVEMIKPSGEITYIDDTLWTPTLSFEFFNTTFKSYASWSLRRNVTKNYIDKDSVIMEFTYILKKNSSTYQADDYEIVTYNISMKGKSLQIQMSGNRGKVTQFQAGVVGTKGSNTNMRLIDLESGNIRSGGVHEIIVVNNTAFYNIDVIFDKSDYSEDLFTSSSSSTNGTAVTVVKATAYKNLTNGSRNNFNDRYFIVFSDNVFDVMLNSKYEKSSNYDLLKDKWVYEAWTSTSLNRWNLTQRYRDFGFDMSKAIFLSSALAIPNPDRSNYTIGGVSPRETAIELGMNITGLGVILSYYNSYQDLYPTSNFYNKTAFNSSNYANCMRHENGSLVSAWSNSCAMRYDKRINVYNYYKNNLSDWKSQGLFLDTEGATADSYTDYEHNSSMRGKLRNQFSYRESLYDRINSDNYYIITENYAGLWTAGIIDAGVGFDCCTDQSSSNIFPAYKQMMINNKMFSIMEYFRRFVINANNDETYKYGTSDSDEEQLDKYNIWTIVYGEATHLDSFSPYMHNLPDNLTILAYYSTSFITNLIRNSQLNNVSYINISNAEYLSSTKALLKQYDLESVLIYESYDNGLIVYANLNRTGWYNSTINGATRNMPPNSLYAYTTDGRFEMFYNDNNQSHWVITPNYIYLHPKNDQTITFDVPLDQYEQYEYYADDSTNGKRSLGITPTLITSYTTNEVRYLTSSLPSGVRPAMSEIKVCEESLSAFELIAIGLVVLVAVSIVLLVKGGGDVDLVSVLVTIIVVSVFVTIGIKIISSLANTGC